MRRFVVLPGSLLVLSVLNAILNYKLQLIAQPYLRVLAIFLMSAFGFGVVSYVVAPTIANALDQVRRTSKRQMGFGGELVWVCVLGLALYALFFVVHTQGPEKLLPAAWRNPSSRP